jgi:hypothetical protein
MSYSRPGPRKDDNLLWLGVDLDNTIAEAIWPESGIGPPIWGNVEKLKAARDAGKKIVIDTSRPWFEYEEIEAWLSFYLIPFDKIVCGKLLVWRMIDDRALPPETEKWY